MDPRLLNPYHDDLFENNFVKCQPQSQFWPDDVESLETQLVDGILPTTPIDVTSNSIFNSFIFKEENYSPKTLLTSNNNSISNDVYEDRKHHNVDFLSQEKTDPNEGSLNSLDDIYNFNDNDNYNNYNEYDYDSDTESDTESDTDNQSKNVEKEDDNISCMTSSFRSRTDSSSIGDYESHSSDYDDDDDDEEDEEDEPIKIHQQLEEEVAHQKKINETKKVKEDADPFAMQLDVTTFDLATFITEDDQLLDNSNANNAIKSQKPTMPIVVVKNDTDSDSDAIVDVETVDNEDILSCNQGQIQGLGDAFVNKNIDLSWNSVNQNVETQQIKSKIIIPGKRIGMGRGKNLKMFDHSPETTNKPKPKENIQKKVKENSIENEVTTESKLNSQDALVSHQTSNTFPTKRKLNLEEYKKRRENLSLPPSLRKTDTIVQSREINKTDCLQQTPKQIPTNPTPTKCTINKSSKNNEVTSIVKSLKENQSNKQIVDPITEAKNKVLRLQELKKAQHIKIIESTVSRKVGRVTKLPPLKDIVKDTYKKSIKDDASVINNSEYEEIVIVSVGCNTDETLQLPNQQNIVKQNPAENATRSLLKCNNMTNSFPNARSDERVKSSGIAPLSIENIGVKTDPESIVSEHGEDKIIMHLRKDRIRKPCVSQYTQTDDCIEKLTSSASKVRRKYRSRQRSYSSDRKTDEIRYREMSRRRKSKSKYSRRRYRSSISSSYSESEDSSKRNHRYRSSSRERSISSNDRRSRRKSFDRIYNRISRSRSRSRSRSKSSSRSRSRRRVDKNVSAPAVEERRIVYVGRIEQETTKEILRKKFIAYGPIKNITIHYKDTGMKYGFVTFEKSEDAFRVIDSGSKDDTINNYDISFGGRRAFCRTSYADLDSAGTNMYYAEYPPRQMAHQTEDDSFEALLSKMKAKLNATKSKVKA